MKVLLEKESTGMKCDLIFDMQTKKILSRSKGENLYWSSSNLHHLFGHLNSDPAVHIKNKYKPMLDKLGIVSCNIEWKQLLGKNNLKAHVEEQIHKIQHMCPLINNYYMATLPIRMRLFDRLRRFIFDGVYYSQLAYSHNKTVTGRTVIVDGMNIMTMKKKDRSLFQSKYKKGSIIELDIKSLEPRLYLKLVKGVEVEDAYSFILEDVLEKNTDTIPRKKIKLAFISLLYGAGEKKIKTMTGLCFEDIRKIRKYLSVAELKQKIKNEFSKNGWFENAYGRKIFSVNAPINYYIQSTAADFACLLYEEFFSNLNTDGVDLIGVIHDAIILDVHPSAKEIIMSVKSIHEPILNTTAYLNIEVHS